MVPDSSIPSLLQIIRVIRLGAVNHFAQRALLHHDAHDLVEHIGRGHGSVLSIRVVRGLFVIFVSMNGTYCGETVAVEQQEKRDVRQPRQYRLQSS